MARLSHIQPGPAASAELRPAGAASGCVAGWICDWTSATGRSGETGDLMGIEQGLSGDFSWGYHGKITGC